MKFVILSLFISTLIAGIAAHSWITVPTPRLVGQAVTATTGAPCGTGVNNAAILSNATVMNGGSIPISWANNGHTADTNPIKLWLGDPSMSTVADWANATLVGTSGYAPLTAYASIPANWPTGTATILWTWSIYYSCVDITIVQAPPMDVINQGSLITKPIRAGAVDYYYVNGTTGTASKAAVFSQIDLQGGDGITFTSKLGLVPTAASYDLMLSTVNGSIDTVLCSSTASAEIDYVAIWMAAGATGQDYTFSVSSYNGFMNYPGSSSDSLSSNKFYAVDAYDTPTTPKRMVLELDCGSTDYVGLSSAQTTCGAYTVASVGTGGKPACVPLTTSQSRKYFAAVNNGTDQVHYNIRVEAGNCASLYQTYTCTQTSASATVTVQYAFVVVIAVLALFM